MRSVMREVFENIPDIVYKNRNGSVVRNTPSSDRGFNYALTPASVSSLDLVQIDLYDTTIEGELVYPIMSWRSCPFDCAFCGGHAVFPHELYKQRKRTPESIVMKWNMSIVNMA